MLHRILPALWVGSLLWAAPPAVKSDLDQSHSEMRVPIERFAADQASLTRAYPLEISTSRRDRMMRSYREWLDTIARLDFDSMSQDGRVDYLLFRNHLQHEHDQQDNQKYSQEAAGSVAPGTTVGPGRQAAEQQDQQNDKKYQSHKITFGKMSL